MKLELKRVALRDTYTIGKLYINGKYFCDTLEDKVRDLNKDGDLNDIGEGKIMHETAIPYGTYSVIMNMSNRFKRVMPLLLDVPHFAGIRIHSGNKAEHSSGCILVGVNSVKGGLTESKKYEKLLYDYLLKEKVSTITIS
jgi:hypothetical protein